MKKGAVKHALANMWIWSVREVVSIGMVAEMREGGRGVREGAAAREASGVREERDDVFGNDVRAGHRGEKRGRSSKSVSSQRSHISLGRRRE
jgi:hypothetical protein